MQQSRSDVEQNKKAEIVKKGWSPLPVQAWSSFFGVWKQMDQPPVFCDGRYVILAPFQKHNYKYIHLLTVKSVQEVILQLIRIMQIIWWVSMHVSEGISPD